MRARVFRWTTSSAYEHAGELDGADADDVWRQLQSETEASMALREGDVVYISDLYLELGGDGSWKQLPPSDLTRRLYALVDKPRGLNP